MNTEREVDFLSVCKIDNIGPDKHARYNTIDPRLLRAMQILETLECDFEITEHTPVEDVIELLRRVLLVYRVLGRSRGQIANPERAVT